MLKTFAQIHQNNIEKQQQINKISIELMHYFMLNKIYKSIYNKQENLPSITIGYVFRCAKLAYKNERQTVNELYKTEWKNCGKHTIPSLTHTHARSQTHMLLRTPSRVRYEFGL